MNKFAITAFAAVAAFGTLAIAQDIVSNPAIASMTADQKVEMREAHMKQNGGILKQAFSGTFVGAEATAAATTLVQNFTDYPALFADGATNAESEALPAVWTDWEKFSALVEKGRLAAVKVLDATKGTDGAAVAAAAKELGGVCGECHQSFRKPS